MLSSDVTGQWATSTCASRLPMVRSPGSSICFSLYTLMLTVCLLRCRRRFRGVVVRHLQLGQQLSTTDRSAYRNQIPVVDVELVGQLLADLLSDLQQLFDRVHALLTVS